MKDYQIIQNFCHDEYINYQKKLKNNDTLEKGMTEYYFGQMAAYMRIIRFIDINREHGNFNPYSKEIKIIFP